VGWMGCYSRMCSVAFVRRIAVFLYSLCAVFLSDFVVTYVGP
jgi:hypothetical protein